MWPPANDPEVNPTFVPLVLLRCSGSKDPAAAETALAADRIPVQAGHLQTECTPPVFDTVLITECRPKARLPGAPVERFGHRRRVRPGKGARKCTRRRRPG